MHCQRIFIEEFVQLVVWVEYTIYGSTDRSVDNYCLEMSLREEVDNVQKFEFGVPVILHTSSCSNILNQYSSAVRV
jgi:hypothetical protein